MIVSHFTTTEGLGVGLSCGLAIASTWAERRLHIKGLMIARRDRVIANQARKIKHQAEELEDLKVERDVWRDAAETRDAEDRAAVPSSAGHVPRRQLLPIPHGYTRGRDC